MKLCFTDIMPCADRANVAALGCAAFCEMSLWGAEADAAPRLAKNSDVAKAALRVRVLDIIQTS